MSKKTLKAKVDDWKHERGKNLLQEQDIAISNYIRGYWADLLDRRGDEEYVAAKAELSQLRERNARLGTREEMILERLEELRAEVDEVRDERDEVQDRIGELEELLSDPDEYRENEEAEDEGGELTSMDGSYEKRLESLLVKFVNDMGSDRGIVDSSGDVGSVAHSTGNTIDDVIEDLREMAEPAADNDNLQYIDDPIERAIRYTDEKPLDVRGLDLVRRAVANEVLDEEKVADEVFSRDAFDF